MSSLYKIINIEIPILLFLILIPAISVQADSSYTSQDTIYATKSDFPIVIDGVLNEPVWRNGNGITRFTQSDPIEGAVPTLQTVVHIAYDGFALYIGARMFDTAPDSIVARLSRKDVWLDSDGFGIFIDPYLDRRSGYYFVLNAAGTYYDGVLLNDDMDDSSWDGVWEGKVQIDEQGWTAEFKIPFSQLRFQKNKEMFWGINFRRDIQRKNEIVQLVYTPKDESGFVSRFPLMAGINNIQAARSIEVLPYTRLKAEYLQADAEDPFNDGSRFIPGFGADMKFGIGNNLTLDGTINPDFGQVEVDPAVVNLSDVEIFFPERRPFFIEGESIFRFGRGGSQNNWGFNWRDPIFFYSRRIGRVPQATDHLPDYDYIDIPDGTSILGAGKLTGKISDWNVGTVLAVTNREYAEISVSGEKSIIEVEPAAGWGILRLQKEIDKGYSGLGIIASGVKRKFKDELLRDQLNNASYSFGIDGWTFLDQDREWVLTAWGGMSRVQGTKQRMIDLQENSQHYFQRPDATHVNVDSNATSLTGYAGRLMLNKQKGNVYISTALGIIEPKFEINDAGFFWRSDVINWHLAGGYQWTEPGEIFRRLDLTLATFLNHDFDMNKNNQGYFHFGHGQFLNYYGVQWAAGYFPDNIDNRKTRGGPLMLDPSGVFVRFGLSSDSRRQWVFEIDAERWSSRSTSWQNEIGFRIDWKPAANISVSIAPEYNWQYENAQYVDQIEDHTAVHTYNKRYIFAELYQKTLSTDIRLNWTFTPKLSLQIYMQPLFAFGQYYGYKELARPESYDFTVYDEQNIVYEEDEIIIYPDGPDGPAEPFVLEKPDFNFRSLRGNAVLRWEYLPGSIFYLVWTQDRYNSLDNNNYFIEQSIVNIWDTMPDNIYMVKLTYWLNM